MVAARSACARTFAGRRATCSRRCSVISSSVKPMIACSGLFSSCATPDTSWPVAASRSAVNQLIAHLQVGVMSRSTPTKCVTCLFERRAARRPRRPGTAACRAADGRACRATLRRRQAAAIARRARRRDSLAKNCRDRACAPRRRARSRARGRTRRWRAPRGRPASVMRIRSSACSTAAESSRRLSSAARAPPRSTASRAISSGSTDSTVIAVNRSR